MASVEVVFALRGNTIPRNHGYALYRALTQALPWLGEEECAGVHAISGAGAGDGRTYISPRAKLVLRLPRARAQQALALTGARLDVGDGVTVGDAHVRPLVPHDTLYARLVATDCEDEQGLEREMAQRLDEAGIRCAIVCGQRGEVNGMDKVIRGYSVLLHPLAPEQSLRVQETGAGPARGLGCGIFVPHKSAAAVGT